MTLRHTPAEGEPETLPKADAAAQIGVSIRTLERYVADGRIEPLPYPLRPRHFAVADIAQLKRTGSATAEVVR